MTPFKDQNAAKHLDWEDSDPSEAWHDELEGWTDSAISDSQLPTPAPDQVHSLVDQAANDQPEKPTYPGLKILTDEMLEDDDAELRRRSKTISRKQMLRERRRMLSQGTIPEIMEYVRPNSRSQCRDMKRPCLYVSCRYHLYLDVNPATGSIKLNFPDKKVWELEETCALDVAERGGITLEEVGDIMNLTRERIRQVEVSGLDKLRGGDVPLHTFVEGRELESYERELEEEEEEE